MVREALFRILCWKCTLAESSWGLRLKQAPKHSSMLSQKHWNQMASEWKEKMVIQPQVYLCKCHPKEALTISFHAYNSRREWKYYSFLYLEEEYYSSFLMTIWNLVLLDFSNSGSRSWQSMTSPPLSWSHSAASKRSSRKSEAKRCRKKHCIFKTLSDGVIDSTANSVYWKSK